MTNDHKKGSLSIGNGGKNNVQLSATLQPSKPDKALLAIFVDLYDKISVFIGYNYTNRVI